VLGHFQAGVIRHVVGAPGEGRRAQRVIARSPSMTNKKSSAAAWASHGDSPPSVAVCGARTSPFAIRSSRGAVASSHIVKSQTRTEDRLRFGATERSLLWAGDAWRLLSSGIVAEREGEFGTAGKPGAGVAVADPRRDRAAPTTSSRGSERGCARVARWRLRARCRREKSESGPRRPQVIRSRERNKALVYLMHWHTSCAGLLWHRWSTPSSFAHAAGDGAANGQRALSERTGWLRSS
jgi:hypothetical protein